MRLVFTANLISMIGSGMNTAAVTWYILQATHSEVSLGIMIALMTLPTLALLPLTGVIIDRNDRRHLMMGLDAARGAIILTVAILALTHRVHLWQVVRDDDGRLRRLLDVLADAERAGAGAFAR